MNEITESQLLCAYLDDRSETAFAELVRRHLDFVYSTAKRLVQDGHLAQDVAQGVFVALARNAAQLRDRPALAGWLHRTAQNIAAQTVRTDVRRRRREQEVVAMNELLGPDAAPAWDSIAPQLDDALNELNEADRDVVFLRYFEKKTAREIAQILGGSEESVHKRAQRAVERLREVFARRGIAAGAGGLAAVISAQAVQAAPADLAAAFTSAALAGAVLPATATSTAIHATTKIIAMTTVQKLIVAATVSVLAGAGIYETFEATRLRQQNLALEQQQAQWQQSQREHAAAPAPVTAAPAGVNNVELLKLRGEVASLQRQADAAKDQARAAEQKLAAELAAKDQFTAHHDESINAASRWAWPCDYGLETTMACIRPT